MERITFLIESTHQRLTCLLNPEDREDSLALQRSSGLAREEEGALLASDLSDSPVQTRGRGDTRLTLKLLFDVALDLSPNPVDDVRDLTRPLWDLTEYTGGAGSVSLRRGQSVAGRNAAGGLPRVRIFWGRGWEIPAVVESVAERYERFTADGRPQRSWLTLRLLRVSDEIPPAELPPRDPAETLPEPEALAPGAAAGTLDNHTWGVHELLGGGTAGDQLWQLAGRYYGDPRLWRLIALANDIANPLAIQAGALLKIPPLKVLARIQTRVKPE